MTQFWIIAAGLIALALAFFLPPLLRRSRGPEVDADDLNLAVIKQQLSELQADLEAGELDQAYYDAARRDLEKELLEDVSSNEETRKEADSKAGRWAIPLIAVLIPMVAVSLYQELGSPQIIERLAASPTPPPKQTQPADHSENSGSAMDIETTLERLSLRLDENPDNLDGWKMLGRSYIALKRADKALEAYERAYKHFPRDVDLILSYASTMASAHGGDFGGRPADLLGKAYEQEPDNPDVLWFMGYLSFQQGDNSKAIELWEKILAMVPPDSEEAQSVNEYLNQARAALSTDSPQTTTLPNTAPKSAAEPTANPAIRVEISLDPSLLNKVRDSDRVFIYARALSGPRMPLAAVRRQVSDLPVTVTLDDSMAMVPQMRLSQFTEVTVGARISKTGDPIPQSGDLEGEITPVKTSGTPRVQVVINNVHP